MKTTIEALTAIFTFVLALLAPLAASSAPNAYEKVVPVFQSDPARPRYYRIPSVVTFRTSKVLVAFAEERIGSMGDSGDINVVYKISLDEGNTWGAKQMLCELNKDTCGNPTAVVDDATDTVHVFMSGNKGHKRQFATTEPGRINEGDRWVLYSAGKLRGNSLVFSPIKNMTASLQLPGTKWDAVGPGAGIKTSSGRLLIPAVQRTIYSDNGGRTWKTSTAKLPKTVSETSIVELDDGGILRSDRPTGYAISKFGRKRRMFSLSRDGGLSFSEPSPEGRLYDPACQGSMLRYSESNLLHANCGSTVLRRNLVIRFSADGREWSSGKLVDRDCGYSSMTKTRDFAAGILYEKSAKKPGLPTEAKDLVFRKFKLVDLK